MKMAPMDIVVSDTVPTFNRPDVRLDIVCFSTAHWDAKLWTNRQRLMSILAERHRILFVEPGLFNKEYTKNLVGDDPRRFLPSNWIREVKRNLWVYAPNILPLYREPDVARRAGWKIALTQIRRFCRAHHFDAPVLWTYTPESAAILGQLRERLVVYDCVDNYAATPYYARKPERAKRLQELERALLQQADVVTVTSRNLYDEKRRWSQNTHYVPNVGDAEHFGRALLDSTPIPDDMGNIPHPIIGFIGAVNSYKVDFPLLAEAAQARPDYHFVLIGPLGGWADDGGLSMLDHPNIHLLGPREYESLPGYLKAFDVCMIPYLQNEYTNGVFPLKFYEYLAGGKAIVSTSLPSLSEHREFCYLAADVSEFVALLSCALAETDDALRRARVEFAQKNTWNHRAARIEELAINALDFGERNTA